MISIAELREYRIWNMAIFDLVGTFIFAFIVHYLLWIYPLDKEEIKKRTIIQYISSLILICITFLGIGVIFHRIFRIKSALSGYLGLNPMPKR